MSRNEKFLWQDAFAGSGLWGTAAGFVGFVMSNKDNGDGRGFFCSERQLSAEMNMPLRTVERAVARLLKEGWIRRTKKGSQASGKASEYILTIPRVDTNPPLVTEQTATGDGPLDQGSLDPGARDEVGPHPGEGHQDVCPPHVLERARARREARTGLEDQD